MSCVFLYNVYCFVYLWGISFYSPCRSIGVMSAFAAWLPCIAIPLVIVAFGQRRRRSDTLLPNPLPSCVENGTIFLPRNPSCASIKVNTHIGKVPHQMG